MKTSIKGMIFLLLFAFSLTSSANTYYVAPSGGSDLNPGTIDRPWATWQKAFNTAVAGDTVYFRGGVWYPTKKVVEGYPITYINPDIGYGHNGTHDNPICFFAYPEDYEAGNIPTLDCYNASNSTGNIAVDVNNVSYLHFKGLTVRNARMISADDNCYGFSFYNTKGKVILENCTAHNIGGAGIRGKNFDTLYYVNCDSYSNCDSLDVSAPGGDGDGFMMSAGGVAADTNRLGVITGCRSFYNSDDAYDIGSTKQIQISNSWAFKNGYYINGIRQYGGDAFKFSYSTVHGSGKRVIHNCISACGAGGFSDNNLNETYYGPRMEYYNNVSYDEVMGFMSGPREWDCDNGIGHDIIRNNIVYKYSYDFAANLYACHMEPWNYVTLDHNTFQFGSYQLCPPNPDYTVTDDDFVSLDTAQLRWPRKSDGSLPDITFMKLKEGSDLINSGIDVGLPYYGSAPDLGWSEYTSGSIVIPSPIYLSSVISNNTPSRLEMTYNLALATINPAASAFSVVVNNIARTVSSVAVSGTKVSLTLASPVVYGDAVTVAYTKPSTNPLQTSAGGQASSLTAQNVINNCLQTGNQPPFITITSPAKSNTFTSPATILIEATVSDPDGSISKVEFYNGATKLGEKLSYPFTYTWKDVTEGTYSLTAVATDNLNSKTVSDVVTAVVEKSFSAVNQLPTIIITHPNNGKKYKKHDNVIIEAVASDPDGTIDKVTFKSGSITLSELTTPPYSFTWEDVDTGMFIITAIATDNLGATGTSSELELTVVDSYNANSEILNLYPNPNDGYFSINFYSSLPNENYRVSIINIAGKTVYNDIIKNQESSREFDLSSKAPGSYILMIINGNEIITAKKFIIK